MKCPFCDEMLSTETYHQQSQTHLYKHFGRQIDYGPGFSVCPVCDERIHIPGYMQDCDKPTWASYGVENLWLLEHWAKLTEQEQKRHLVQFALVSQT